MFTGVPRRLTRVRKDGREKGKGEEEAEQKKKRKDRGHESDV
jgi:hypothetical protein